jgi:phage shock protein PspC (stress-responsive transcriptional regulator)
MSLPFAPVPTAPRGQAAPRLAGVCAAVARWFDLPVGQVRLVVAALVMLTGGVAALPYLALWAALPGAPGPRWPRLAARVGLAATAVGLGYHALVTRGTVTRSADGRPLAGADVVLLDGDRAVAWARADARGRFRLWHAPGGRRGRALAICAHGMAPMYTPEASSALVGSAYGLGARRAGSLEPPPAALARAVNAPATCTRPAA